MENSRKSIYNTIFQIAWPALIELTLTQVASMVDMMMIGRLGAPALSAVGFTTQPKFLMMTFFVSMNVGVTAVIARYRGAGENQKANEVFNQMFVVNFFMGLLISVAGYVLSKPMVCLMGARDPYIIQAATDYMHIQMLLFVFLALTYTITAALRAIGDSKTAMIYNLVANLVNVILNYMLIYGNFGMPRMEVAGASLATVLGQLLAFLIAVIYIYRKKMYFSFHLLQYMKIKWELIGPVLKIGFPAMGEQVVMRVGLIIYGMMVASIGTIANATHMIGTNLMMLTYMIGQAFAASATTMVGQSLGMKRPDMAETYAKASQKMGLVLAVLTGIIFLVFNEQLIMLYNTDSEVVRLGTGIIIILGIMQPIQSTQFIITGALRGAGDTTFAAILSFITILLIRPLVAALMIYVLHQGLIGAWLAMVCDQLIRTVGVLVRFKKGKWKGIRI